MTTQVQKVERADILALIESHEAKVLNRADADAFKRVVAGTEALWIGRKDGVLVCAWGIMPSSLADNRAYLWLHVTDAVGDYTFAFVRRSQIAVQEMLRDYPVITGHCRTDARQSRRWVKWLGGVFGSASGGLVPFEIVRKDG